MKEIRWEQSYRYRLIEVISQWEGGINTKQLIESFGIGRQQASKDLQHYNTVINPGSLTYNPQLRRYQPSTTFSLVLTEGTVDEYLTLLVQESFVTGLKVNSSTSEVLPLPIRAVSPQIMRPLLQACREQKRLDVDYVSVNNPDREGRVIVPHTLVNNGLRWHVRAWCEKNNDYRDFVLSRFRGTAEILDSSSQSIGLDKIWNENVTIIIEPDIRLTPEQKSVVEQDYGMQNGQMLVKTRGALVQYVLQQLQIDTQMMQIKPEAQQICVANLNELRGFLFG